MIACRSQHTRGRWFSSSKPPCTTWWDILKNNNEKLEFSQITKCGLLPLFLHSDFVLRQSHCLAQAGHKLLAAFLPQPSLLDSVSQYSANISQSSYTASKLVCLYYISFVILCMTGIRAWVLCLCGRGESLEDKQFSLFTRFTSAGLCIMCFYSVNHLSGSIWMLLKVRQC